MVWNVYRRNFNTKELEKYNVFSHWSFRESLERMAKRRLNRENFDKHLRREVMYYFWSKCEWEVIITSWPAYITSEELTRLNKELEEERQRYGRNPRILNVRLREGDKIDVYNQLMLNWELFSEYVWNHRKELREMAKQSAENE